MADISGIFGGAPATTFMGLPAGSLESVAADVAILGIPNATPYPVTGSYAEGAPAAIRGAVAGHASALGHMDFDLGGPILGDGRRRVVDLGDLPTQPDDAAGNRRLITRSIATILAAGAVPVILGGDDSTPIPVLEAYAGEADAGTALTILQLDAHIDWRDEVGGERLGLSSNMRRASEMAHVGRMVQVGQRGIGSARPADHEDALRRGVRFVSARDLHAAGVGRALDEIPGGGDVFVNLDIDSLDPSIMPAVIGPAPGGLTYWQVIDLLTGVAAKARIAGFALVEFTPSRDPDGLAALTAARIVANVIGLLARG
jgi:agmatinase